MVPQISCDYRAAREPSSRSLSRARLDRARTTRIRDSARLVPEIRGCGGEAGKSELRCGAVSPPGHDCARTTTVYGGAGLVSEIARYFGKARKSRLCGIH